MKRVVLGLSILTVGIGVAAYASIRVPLRRELRRIEGAQHVRISRHVRHAFVAVLVDSPNHAALEKVLIKTLYVRGSGWLAPEKTLRRRLAERTIGNIIGLLYDDEALLRTYLDQIYMGRDGAREIIGLADAARFFLRKDLSEVTLPEAALLAGIHRSPNALSPLAHPDRALFRRNLVLQRMMQMQFIVQDEYESAVSTPVSGRA